VVCVIGHWVAMIFSMFCYTHHRSMSYNRMEHISVTSRVGLKSWILDSWHKFQRELAAHSPLRRLIQAALRCHVVVNTDVSWSVNCEIGVRNCPHKKIDFHRAEIVNTQ
jgi:hypothetical protein